ncbi:MAG: hypothetical protein A2Z97_09325 [Bdellovibrionales bacterium GWB1_52_6]|nr:MAG: hypothetical protein A2Z97_09325 [Bdellovibrionales bacterium GWB1_52_6]OFZ04129.1 MAG: hypothetical protein A2X97_15125 [Bdellovibrionales bacterium GWA1_52_35]HCM40469.1 hypothetical protein [Bdellovibrionales bacterium]
MVKRIFFILWPFLILLGPYFLFGALVGSIPGYMLYSYVWKDDKFCTSCHVHDYASIGWKTSIHGELTTCHDCHHQPLIDYAKEAIVLITKQPKFPMDLHHIPHVPVDICGACHLTEPEQTATVAGPMTKKDISKLPKVDQLYLHELHLRMETRMPLPRAFPLGKEKAYGTFEESARVEQKTSTKRSVMCMDCHGGPANRAHDFSVADRSCVRCHANTHRTELVKKLGCRTCHFQDFLTPVSATLPESEKKP